ncbi:MAG: hypothetical protein Kow00129_15290 [Thermoleophilia bacterium]
MAPVPAPKKFWVFDGGVEQYPSVFSSGSVHMGMTCTGCHGGDDSANTRAEAHSGTFQEIPGGPLCLTCHRSLTTMASTGLHTTLAGYEDILGQRGFPMEASDQAAAVERYEKECTRCHTANEAEETACGQCHVSKPNTVQGGLVSGHAFNRTPSMDNNCTACHGSRVRDEYYGMNNALLDRNAAAYPDGHPLKDTAYTLEPDVHKTAGLTCMDCHSGAEMHGEGHPADGNRYEVTSSPACVDCHPTDTAFESVTQMHSSGHVDQIDCYVCHAQPYKSCYECHTDETAEGLGFYGINQNDPTLEDRKAASSDPDSVQPDSLITFRAGLNPLYDPTDPDSKMYSVLRHSPIDRDLFKFSGDKAIDGLIGNGITNIPTWRYATPHTIKRNTLITKSCANCHNDSFVNFWLTDPLANSLGWVSPQNEADESAANAGVTVDTPPGGYFFPSEG